MKYKQPGNAGLYVSELCLGTMTPGGNAGAGMWTAIGAPGQEEANRLPHTGTTTGAIASNRPLFNFRPTLKES
ncbi:hypothetical protein C7402_112265 [Paraburkholderia unamae]|uniref:Uncharacterized protein n=1 Tax=Paraburkholderia unamae TaxID=219649 RepID=A0ABX5KK54_9BURK|nr:hypothetical protein C7402_112265 [Paraburkholderia unamae]